MQRMRQPPLAATDLDEVVARALEFPTRDRLVHVGIDREVPGLVDEIGRSRQPPLVAAELPVVIECVAEQAPPDRRLDSGVDGDITLLVKLQTPPQSLNYDGTDPPAGLRCKITRRNFL